MLPPYPSSAAIEAAVARTVTGASLRGIAIHRVEYIAPSEIWCKTLAIVVFYETDDERQRRAQDETGTWFRAEFEEQLRASENALPFERMPDEITYEFDSHENVLRNYEGSYFLRLR